VRPSTVPKLGFGVRIPEPAAKEIRALIAALPRLAVPRPLKQVWKRWSFPKRRAFVKKLRVRFPSTRPTGPFSKNVEPFEYGTPRVCQIAAAMNVGRNSQTKIIALKPGSEGVIWCGQIFFWDGEQTYVRGTGWRKGEGRPLLSHIIWTKTHRRPVPPQNTVIFLDGNKNNFDPHNLGLRTMADCARQNQVFLRLKDDPDNPELKCIAAHVLERSHEGRRAAIARRAQAALNFLLKNNKQLKRIAA
jgi:hypothetical protein